MSKYIPVVDSNPSAYRKGLRIKVQSVELDENNNLIALHIDYSGWRERGFARVEVSQRNRFDLPEEMNMSRKKKNRKNTMPVDKERLLTAIRKKGIDVYTAGELCGKSRRYVRNFVDRGLIGEDNIKSIEECLGIPYSDYCPVDKKKNEEIDLYQLIKIAKNENIEIEIYNNGKKIRIRPLG